jgi:hypothetical protein
MIFAVAGFQSDRVGPGVVRVDRARVLMEAVGTGGALGVGENAASNAAASSSSIAASIASETECVSRVRQA